MKEKKIVSKDKNNNPVTVVVRTPSPQIYRDAQIVYNKALRESLEKGAMFKDKLYAYLKEQGIWSEEKDKQIEAVLDDIRQCELRLKKGGIPLKEAKNLAIDMRKLRGKLTELFAEKQEHDADCAESLASNVRFDFLVSACVYKENGEKVWANQQAYEADSEQPWTYQAASELASMLYGLDPDYDKNLVENQFLTKYKFADESLRLINKDGHLIDEFGRLINEEGRFVSYREDGEQYYVNIEGQEVDEDGNLVIEFSPFLDDEGNPIVEDEEPSKKTRKKRTVNTQ